MTVCLMISNKISMHGIYIMYVYDSYCYFILVFSCTYYFVLLMLKQQIIVAVFLIVSIIENAKKTIILTTKNGL